MPYKRGDSKYWWISYTVGGRQIKESARTTVWREARTLETEKRAEAAKRGPTPRYEYDKMMETYLSEIEDQPNYARSEWAAIALTEYFSGRAVDSITRQDLVDYRNQRGASDATVIKELHTLSAAARRAKEIWGWRIDNPVTWTPPAPKGRLRWLSKPEARKLINAAHKSTQAPYLADLIRVALFTGMRKGEILGLTWDRVDLRRKLVYLEPEHQKGRRYDSVPLNTDAVAAIKRQKGHDTHVFVHDGEPIASVRRSFGTACRNAEIVGFRFHDLRHTCAAWLVQSGVPIRTVAEIMRHRSIQTTMRYAHLAPEHTRKAVAGLSL